MGVCGTDVSSFLGKFPFFDYPRIPGHELGVEVLAAGPGVTSVQTGDRCSVEPYMNCRVCHACRTGHPNCCSNLQVIGVMLDGGLRDRFLIRADKLHAAGALTFDQLALVETLAIGCHATSRAAPRKDDQVLIIGAGPIGLATLEFTRLTGARVTVMDLSETRLAFCRRVYGVDRTIVFRGDGREPDEMQAATGGEMFTVVIDATGDAGSMSRALNYVAHTGTLVYVGVTTHEISFPHPLLHRREMTLKGARNALPGDFSRIIALIESGTVDTSPWITHRTTFDRAPQEFASFTRPGSGVIKAMIEVN